MVIIAVVYLPILTLTGVEGKMFTPMAVTVLMILAAAAVLSITFLPAAIAIFVTGRVYRTRKHPHAGCAPRLCAAPRYVHSRPSCSRPLLRCCLLASPAFAASRMGTEFIPSLDEGDAAVQALRIPGTSLSQSVEMQLALEKRLLQMPEVKEVFARVGTAEVATDPDAAVDFGRLRDAQAARAMA